MLCVAAADLHKMVRVALHMLHVVYLRCMVLVVVPRFTSCCSSIQPLHRAWPPPLRPLRLQETVVRLQALRRLQPDWTLRLQLQQPPHLAAQVYSGRPCSFRCHDSVPWFEVYPLCGCSMVQLMFLLSRNRRWPHLQCRRILGCRFGCCLIGPGCKQRRRRRRCGCSIKWLPRYF